MTTTLVPIFNRLRPTSPARRRGRWLAPLLAFGLLAPAGVAQAQTTLNYTGGTQTYTVPAGITQLKVVAQGASGGGASAAVVTAFVAVTPGEVLTVVVGGRSNNPASPSVGGYNGGGNGDNADPAIYGNGGGGATDLRRTGASTGDYLTTRNALVVAGGSGGDGDDDSGGDGGTPVGGNGNSGGGNGGTASGPGTGTGTGANGVANVGGNAGAGTSGGGGGGGGYYGGGGGGNPNGEGGGGGSSFVTTTGSSGISYALATALGNGTIVLTPVAPGLAVTGISPTNGPVGTSVSISGTGFTGATGVRINGTAVTGFTVNSATSITATVAAGTPVGGSSGNVVVSNASGISAGTVSFTVTTAPTLSTSIFSVVGTTATLGGNVASEGGQVVSERGVVYSTSTNPPTVADTKVVINSGAGAAGTGSFSQAVGGLAASTLYYVRAYAINSVGTSYGGLRTFTTGAATATITGLSPTSGAVGTTVVITGTGFLLGGNNVRFNGILITSGSTNSTTQITAVVPSGATTGNVTVQNSNGTSNGILFTVPIRPGVTTNAATSVVYNGATLNGNVTSDGGSAVTERGFAYSRTSINPNITNDTRAVAGSGLGTYSQAVTGLIYGNTYYVRAYAINAVGITYGSTVSFVTPGLPANFPTIASLSPANGPVGTSVSIGGTNFVSGGTTVTFNGTAATSVTVNSASSLTVVVPAGATTGFIRITTSVGTTLEDPTFTVTGPPTVTTAAATALTNTSATLGGNVTADGGTGVSERGVVYSISNTTPTVADTKVMIGSGTGAFSQSVTGLTPNTLYYVRGYALNAVGYGYGPVVLVTTNANAPTLTALNPTTGPVGTSVTLTGTNFVGVTGVTFSGMTATGVTTNSATSVTAVVPAGVALGASTVVLTANGGSTSGGPTFTVTASPVALTQTVTTFNSGSGLAGVPASGVTSLLLQAWGGGGGGDNTYMGSTGGNGGGGGAFNGGIVSVTPGQGFAYSVGAGGAVNADGTGSSVGTYSASPGRTNGTGGQTGLHRGGNGGTYMPTGIINAFGGGGGSATPTADGGNGSTNGGPGTGQGNGASGGGLTVTPNPPGPPTYGVYNAGVAGVPGGGGGGGGTGNGLTAAASAGGNGRVVFYLCGPIAISGQPLATQTVCENAATTTLTVTSSSITAYAYQWYSSPTSTNSGGTAITGATSASYTPPSPETNYYYVVVRDACNTSSATSNVAAVIVNSTSTAPTGSASQSLPTGATVADLVATGPGIKWYATSTGGTALASTTALTNGSTYYATQTTSCGESTNRLAVTVTLVAPTVATVTTATPTSLTNTGATLGGNVTADGGSSVSERGVVYVPGTGTPTTGNTKVVIGSGTGSFSQAVTGLSVGTQYTVRAYAINAQGTSYGSSQSFTTTGVASLTISTGSPAMPVSIAAGTYNNITVTTTGFAQLAGAVVVNGAVSVAGSLNTNCQSLTGPGSFALAAGGTLYVCDAAGLTTTGNTGAVRTATRSFSPDASYIYNGTAQQTTGAGLPATVRNLTIDNPVGVTQPGALSIAQVLTLANTGDIIQDTAPLTILSNASGTGLVVNSSTGRVNGYLTVERYLDPTVNPGLGYRHYASPVTGNHLSDLAMGGFTPVFNPGTGPGTGYNGSATPATATPFPTVFGYDQARLATAINNLSAFDKGWFSPAATDAFAPAVGYTVSIAGTTKLAFTGTPNTGTIPVALARNSGTTAADAGWHLVGNPYPAPLDWSTVLPADRTGLDGAMYVFQSTSQYVGTYRAYTNGVGQNPLIASSQGFFVRVSSGQTSGTLTYRNSQRKTSFADQVSMRRGAADPRPQVQLTLAGTGGRDDLYVYAEAGATAGADAAYDAVKLPNTNGMNLASLAATGEQLAIDGRPAFTAATRIPLALAVPAAGSYTLTAANLANFTAADRAELVDNLTGTRTLLTTGTAYAFTTATTTAPGRFFLNLTAAGALATATAALQAQVLAYPNPAHGTLTVLRPAGPAATGVLYNALGQTVQTLALPTAETTLDLRGLASGVYTLRLTIDGQPVAKRLVIE